MDPKVLRYSICGFPPSANAMFGRSAKAKTPFRSAAYNAFIDAARAGYLRSSRPKAPRGAAYAVEMVFHPPNKRWYDVDNRIKPTLDTLVRLGILDDDRGIVRLVAEKGDPVEGGRVDVVVTNKERIDK